MNHLPNIFRMLNTTKIMVVLMGAFCIQNSVAQTVNPNIDRAQRSSSQYKNCDNTGTVCFNDGNDMMKIYNAQYACGVVGPANSIYDASNGQYVQVFSTSNLRKYVCIEAIDKIDHWQETTTQYCTDTQFNNVSTKNTKICLHNLVSGKQIACKNRGESVLAPKSEVAGCIKVTCQDNYTKSGNQCVANCTSADNMEVSCPVDRTNYLNAKSCVRECINGKLEIYVKDCINNSYTKSGDRKSCIKNPQVTTSTSTTSRTSSGGNSSSTGVTPTPSTTTSPYQYDHLIGQQCQNPVRLPEHATNGFIIENRQAPHGIACMVTACQQPDWMVNPQGRANCIRNTTTPTPTTGGSDGTGENADGEPAAAGDSVSDATKQEADNTAGSKGGTAESQGSETVAGISNAR